MAKRKLKPDEALLEKYNEKLRFWENRKQESLDRDDYSEYNWAIAQINVMKEQIKDLKERLHSKYLCRKQIRKEEDEWN